MKKVKHDTKKITTELLTENVKNVDTEAHNKRWTRQQMLDFILAERYKDKKSELE